jgi:hypothetical protein|tara:strand:- start:1386 stop:1700 length:315 start_codon:yes stop_codon:yes gene_type:complete
MPTYSFVNEKTNEEFSELMSMSEREAFLSDNPNIRQLPPTQMNIVAGVGGIRTDNGWKENLSRIAEAHPTSELASTHGDKSAKDVKTRQVVDKWKKKRAADTTK